MNKLGVMIHKEWLEIRREKWLLGSIGLMLVLLTGIPFAVLSNPASSNTNLSGLINDPAFRGLNEIEVLQITLMRQFLLLYMMMPLYIPATISAYSIVGEKSKRTLEPLIAAPIHTHDLLLAKILVAAIPAVLVSWLGYGIYTLGTRAVVVSEQVYAQVFTLPWLLAILLWVPLLTLIAVGLGVIISSRVNDPRTAQQLTGVVVVPVLIVFFAQLSGLLTVSASFVLLALVPLAICAAAILYAAIRMFNRETILTRWS
jgi:ABC-2 type transport system permease protein